MKTKLVIVKKRVIITDADAKKLLVEARAHEGEIDVYKTDYIGEGTLERVFTLPLPIGMNDEKEMLEHARNNMPKNIDF